LEEYSISRGSNGVFSRVHARAFTKLVLRPSPENTDSDDLNGTLQSNEMKERKRPNASSRNVSLAEDGRVSTSVSLMLRSRPVRFVAPGSFIRASRKEILAPRVPNSSNPSRINSPCEKRLIERPEKILSNSFVYIF